MTALTLAANHDHAGTWALVALVCLICAACIVKAVRDETARRDAYDAAWFTPVRDDGMGALTGTPIFDQLAAETATDAAQFIDTEWWLETGGAS